MTYLKAEQVSWSEEQQKRIQSVLVGNFATDTWPVGPTDAGLFLHFKFSSPALQTEMKYAFWSKLEQGTWKVKETFVPVVQALKYFAQWLDDVAPQCMSLMEKDLDTWEHSLRSWLLKQGLLRPGKQRRFTAKQIHEEFLQDDFRIRLFRQIYTIIANAYDERPETEKDIWDLLKLGLALNQSMPVYHLNFTSIQQPWLRQFAKVFMKYNMAIHSVSDCTAKLLAIKTFSQFLSQHHPSLRSGEINRSLIVEYIGYLQTLPVKVSVRNHWLTQLRTVLETGAYHLGGQDLPKERLIFGEDMAKEPQALPRDIPEEVLAQVRDHLETLETTALRMVVILLECGLRISELCLLPLDCLICDDKHEWYLRLYQSKLSQEHVIPLVNETVIGVIQAQQQDIRERWGNTCPYLFTRPSSQASPQPFLQQTFYRRLNAWVLEKGIQDRTGRLYAFQSHQFRHTVGMRLINDDVPLEVIRRIFGHRSMQMTQRYARMRASKVREALEQAALARKTVNAQGQVVRGDSRANNPDVQLVRKGIRGQTLAIGGCGRLVVLGECNHTNKCLTCPMWLTSTDDLPALKMFHERAIRLKQRATEVGSQVVVHQQEAIITSLALRLKSLQPSDTENTFNLDETLAQIRTDLAEAESGLEEAQTARLLVAAKQLERTVRELKARLVAMEGK